MGDDALFEVVTPAGHRYAVYRSGEVSGFPEGSFVLNHFPQYAQAAVVRAMNYFFTGVLPDGR